LKEGSENAGVFARLSGSGGLIRTGSRDEKGSYHAMAYHGRTAGIFHGPEKHFTLRNGV
jgi:hypothetical protein